MKEKFTIGEISKLFNVNTTLLRYYDKIGLYTPNYIDKNNNYRYYTIEQFEHLNTIRYLRNLDIPVETIKSQLDNANIQGLLSLFEEQRESIFQRIQELKSIEEKLEKRIYEMKNSMNYDLLENIREEYIDDRMVIILENKMTTLHDFEISIRKLENLSHKKSSFFCGQVGFSVSKENLLKKNINVEEYDSVFMLIEEDIPNKKLQTLLPEGIYICLRYNGTHKDAPKYYEKLLNYINENEYEILDDSIEIQLIDPHLTNNNSEVINEIQILVDTHK